MTDKTANTQTSSPERAMQRTMDEIPVISMWQPWAQWVSLGWKPIETRTHKRFASLVGKRIGIHASLKWDLPAMGAAAPYLTFEQRTASLPNIGGAINCTAFVEAFRKLTPEDAPLALIECETERYGLFLKDVRPIGPIPCKGMQGIWYEKGAVTR